MEGALDEKSERKTEMTFCGNESIGKSLYVVCFQINAQFFFARGFKLFQ
jgi:hypothetical protein